MSDDGLAAAGICREDVASGDFITDAEFTLGRISACKLSRFFVVGKLRREVRRSFLFLSSPAGSASLSQALSVSDAEFFDVSTDAMELRFRVTLKRGCK